jgi:hypothetical protein
MASRAAIPRVRSRKMPWNWRTLDTSRLGTAPRGVSAYGDGCARPGNERTSLPIAGCAIVGAVIWTMLVTPSRGMPRHAARSMMCELVKGNAVSPRPGRSLRDAGHSAECAPSRAAP